MESETIKIQIHRLQKEVNEIMPNNIKDKIEQLMKKMDDLEEALEKEKPHRYYVRQWALQEGARAYYHLLSQNRS